MNPDRFNGTPHFSERLYFSERLSTTKKEARPVMTVFV